MSLFYGQITQPPITYYDSIAIPRGVTPMFHGSSTIPTGWDECNGKNGTPDLSDKFIVAVGDNNTVWSTGGWLHVNTNFGLPPSALPCNSDVGGCESQGLRRRCI